MSNDSSGAASERYWPKDEITRLEHGCKRGLNTELVRDIRAVITALREHNVLVIEREAECERLHEKDISQLYQLSELKLELACLRKEHDALRQQVATVMNVTCVDRCPCCSTVQNILRAEDKP